MKYIEAARKEIRKLLTEYLKTEEAAGPEYELLLTLVNQLDGYNENGNKI